MLIHQLLLMTVWLLVSHTIRFMFNKDISPAMAHVTTNASATDSHILR